MNSLKNRRNDVRVNMSVPIRWKILSSEEIQLVKKEPKEKPFTIEENDYLIEIARTPFEPATDRDKRLVGNSGYKGNSLRTKLVQRNMVAAHKIFTGKRGGQITLFETTPEAWKYLNSIKAGVEPPRGKGGFLHKYYYQ